MAETVRVTDGGGGRTLGCELYLPRFADDVSGGARAAPAATVLISPAFGAGPGDYRPVATAWAAGGLACLVVHHPCCDRDAVRGLRDGAARGAATGTTERELRVADVRAVLDAVRAGRIRSGLRDAPVGLAGHSMGARTALTFATGEAEGRPPDAYVVLSPSAPADEAEREAYRRIRSPALHVTGPRDISPFGITPPARRRIPFDETTSAEAYLLLLRGLGHHDALGRAPATASTRALATISTLFWSAYLHGVGNGRDRLRSNVFSEQLPDVEAWEWH